MVVEKFSRQYFDGACCRLSILVGDNPDKPNMLLMHGMRDHALSMLSIAENFSADYNVRILDLRGHGYSDNPGAYAMTQFVADLYALFLHFEIKRSVIIAHSLGGHIASRFSAIYPEYISELILLDGMGPPGMGAPISDDVLIEYHRYDVDNALILKAESRQMVNEAEALQRLTNNNPRLEEDTAKLLVEHGVEALPNGKVKWRWDPRMNMVWGTFPSTEMEKLWGLIDCRVLIVTGDESPGYWVNMRGDAGVDLIFYASELLRRKMLFKSAENAVIEGAGHMLHYDQPDKLNDVIKNFLTG
ncbi:MAG: pimeloyl-ACP methyl ester carboxylesterase [Flavobacterium sp.]|jgi:pimeloyl-ACP methyl ester carboxylesterase